MKKAFSIAVCALMLGLIPSFSSASASVPSAGSSNAYTDNDLVSYFMQYPMDESFGGFYYDGETFVVNYVGSPSNIVQPKVFANAEKSIEYRSVPYSLHLLESVKDYLGARMHEYGILVLDANEMTSQVDVSLKECSEEIKAAIEALVEQQFGSNECLNFIDLSGTTIQSTVAYERPDYHLFEQFLSKNRAMDCISMFPIRIDSGYYTLGPAVAANKGYTAGHGVSSGASVYTVDPVTVIPGFYIGWAQAYYGGSNRDWSLISASVTLKPIVKLIPPVAGASVYMWGAVTTMSPGTITATNVTVSANIPFKDLTGMCAASYKCAEGDSGAGIFNDNNINSVTASYGVQSSALFYTGTTTWAGTSYFTPLG